MHFSSSFPQDKMNPLDVAEYDNIDKREQIEIQRKTLNELMFLLM